jgi:hypothetical protein
MDKRSRAASRPSQIHENGIEFRWRLPLVPLTRNLFLDEGQPCVQRGNVAVAGSINPPTLRCRI